MCKKLTTEEFIKKATLKRGDKFDYMLVNYKTSYCNVQIICKKCNYQFSEQANNHLYGSKECPNCNIGSKKTTERYIKDVVKIHGNKFDYSLVNYKSSQNYVNIICKKCSCVFSQRAASHYTSGCPNCAAEETTSILHKKNLHKFTNLYLLKIHSNTEVFIKIGISNNIRNRIGLIMRESNYKPEILNLYNDIGFTIVELEKQFKKKYRNYKYRPNINFNGYTECFDLDVLSEFDYESENWHTLI